MVLPAAAGDGTPGTATGATVPVGTLPSRTARPLSPLLTPSLAAVGELLLMPILAVALVLLQFAAWLSQPSTAPLPLPISLLSGARASWGEGVFAAVAEAGVLAVAVVPVVSAAVIETVVVVVGVAAMDEAMAGEVAAVVAAAVVSVVGAVEVLRGMATPARTSSTAATSRASPGVIPARAAGASTVAVKVTELSASSAARWA